MLVNGIMTLHLCNVHKYVISVFIVTFGYFYIIGLLLWDFILIITTYLVIYFEVNERETLAY